LLVGSDGQRILHRSHGRVAEGSAYQCFHGKRVIMQTVLEWEPFEQLTTEDLVMPNTTVLTDYRLEPAANGTRLVETLGKVRGPLYARVIGLFELDKIRKAKPAMLAAFKQRVEANEAQRTTPASAAPLPAAAILEAASASLAAPE
jgi:hypothetical protein